jgi:type IV pilus assembly protein PilB
MVQFDDSFSNSRITRLRAQEEERMIQARAPQLGFPYIDLKSATINPEALATIPEDEAKLAKVVAFDLRQKKLEVAVQNPTLPVTQSLLKKLQDQKYILNVHMCSSESLTHAWKRYSDVVGTTAEIKGVFTIDTKETEMLIEKIKEKSDINTILQTINTKNNSRRISDTLALIFAGSIALKASDIHLEPEEHGVRLRYRLDGVLHDIADLDNYIHERVMSRLKLLSGMVLNVKIEAQDGRFTFHLGEKEVEVRSSIIPGAVGESIVMRLLDPSVAGFSMDKINLNEPIKKMLLEQLKRPNGLIITTGPTGSGKTTALYAFLREVNQEGTKIITIENPVEYKLDGVMHTQTAPDYTFAQGLRAILRQDPDVIMVGEIRDHEVAETAIHAAQTGHLVFSTLHTNNAIAGFTRLVDLGINPQVLGTSINVILGQRLVRLLCTECKKPYQASSNEIRTIQAIAANHPHPPQVEENLTLYKPVGCTTCRNTGFKGRTGVFEGVLMDETVEEVIVRDPREHTIKEAAKPQKIPTMLEDGIDKVLSGVTSIQELKRVVEFPRDINFLDNDTPVVPEDISPTSPDEISDDDFAKHIV